MRDSVVIPVSITKYFWGDNLSQLSWSNHKKYIVETLLEKGDKKAISWLFKKVNKSELKSMLPSLKLGKKSSNFWDIYLS
jgi:hypothetical protein